jgi:hypothetical protein
MLEKDRPRFALCLNAAAATFRVEVTKPLAHGYWLGLSALPIEVVERAFAIAMERCRFMPTPAELRELVCEPEAKPDDRAVKAWMAFERAVVDHGGYASVQFDDPITTATIRALGGWQRCCGLPPEEFDTWLRKDFMKTYAALCRTGVGPEACLPLGGIHESNNMLSGHTERIREPTLVAVDLPPLPNAPRIARDRPAQKAIGMDIGRMPQEAN